MKQYRILYSWSGHTKVVPKDEMSKFRKHLNRLKKLGFRKAKHDYITQPCSASYYIANLDDATIEEAKGIVSEMAKIMDSAIYTLRREHGKKYDLWLDEVISIMFHEAL